MTTRSYFRAVLLVTAFGCVAGARDLSAQAVRDSAGIRIVMNTKSTWTPAQQLQLSAKPTLVVGTQDSDTPRPKSIRGAFYLSDGRIVVGERLSAELRVYDASGKYLTTFGRKGEAPGEFREFGKTVRLAGDTIAVFHEDASISRFTSSGKFITRTRDQSPLVGLPTSFTDALVALNGGARVTMTERIDRPVGAIGSRIDATGTVEVVRGDGVSTKKPGELALMQATVGKSGRPRQLWLAAEAVYADNGSQFVFGYGTSYSLTKYSAEGVPTLIVRREWTPAPVSSKDWEEWTDEWLKRWSKKTGAALAAERQDLLDDDYQDALPAFSAVVLDNTGKLWVRAPKTIDGAVAGSLNDYPIGPSTWSVFSDTGIWLGDVVMPSKFEPTDIGKDYVLGIARDDDVTPTVVRYKLGPK